MKYFIFGHFAIYHRVKIKSRKIGYCLINNNYYFKLYILNSFEEYVK